MSRRDLTQGDRAEKDGAALGCQLIEDLQDAVDQAERSRMIQEALLTLHDMPHRFDRAAGGFSGQIVCFLEVGLGLAERSVGGDEE